MKRLMVFLLFSIFVFASCDASDDSGDTNNFNDWNNSNNINNINNINNTSHNNINNGEVNNTNNTNNTNNINNTNNTNNTNNLTEHELICLDATSVETTFFMSADDSNSQAHPVYLRNLILNHSYSIQNPYYYNGSSPREYEFLNYYDFDYEPAAPGTLSIVPELKFNPGTQEYSFLVGVVAPSFELAERRPFNFTFSCDTSGSMSGSAIESLKDSLRALAAVMQDGDIVSVVDWNTSQNIILDGHQITGPNDPAFLETIAGLSANGGTNLNAGLQAGYNQANLYYSPDKINRVFLISDGGANVGVTDANLIGEQAEFNETDGIFLVGIGTADLTGHDLMDTVTDMGKGAYLHIPDENEAYRVFSEEKLLSNVEVAALDVRLEVTFPPYLMIAEFHGEEISTNPEEVKEQHLAPNDAMLYHSNLLMCPPEEMTKEELEDADITLRVTWTDPFTMEDHFEEITVNIADLLDIPAVNLEKADILIEYSHLLANFDQISNQTEFEETKLGLLNKIQSHPDYSTDPDFEELETVLNNAQF